MEEEGNAEKHQLAAMHQQRVLAHINQRKREAMICYTQSLTEMPPNVMTLNLNRTIKITNLILKFFFRVIVLKNAYKNCCVHSTKIVLMHWHIIDIW